MLVCKLVSWVSGEPTLTIPGELTDILAGDMATVCKEFNDGFMADALLEVAFVVDEAVGGMGVPSAIN